MRRRVSFLAGGALASLLVALLLLVGLSPGVRAEDSADGGAQVWTVTGGNPGDGNSRVASPTVVVTQQGSTLVYRYSQSYSNRFVTPPSGGHEQAPGRVQSPGSGGLPESERARYVGTNGSLLIRFGRTYTPPGSRPLFPPQPPQPPQPPAGGQQPDGGTPGTGTPQDVLRLFQLVNEARRANGLAPLRWNDQLARLAQLKAEEMVQKGYFSHTSPTYGSPFDMMRRAGLRFSYAGENLAGNPSVEGAHRALMNSPGHRSNILNPNYTDMGIGAASGGRYGKIFVEMFLRP